MNASTTETTPTYPEHEKLVKVKDKSQAVGEFLDWLTNERGLVIARWRRDGKELLVDGSPLRDLLAEYFVIDQDKLEAEKRAMLDAVRRTAVVSDKVIINGKEVTALEVLTDPELRRLMGES